MDRPGRPLRRTRALPATGPWVRIGAALGAVVLLIAVMILMG